MLDSIEENTKLIFIANPNNPTGSFIEQSELLNFLEKVPEEIIVLLDQAYFEYSSFETSDLEFDVLEISNLIISRSFSKAYGLAGFKSWLLCFINRNSRLPQQGKTTLQCKFSCTLHLEIALDDDQFIKNV